MQPFDDLKLFSNILVSWLVLQFAPGMTYWPGILMVFAGSAYLLWSERGRMTGAARARDGCKGRGRRPFGRDRQVESAAP